MMPDGQSETFRLYARLREHKQAVTRARRHVARWLDQCKKPYVAFSGGKDSTCTLALVRELSPGTTAVYFDADCAFPEVAAILETTPNTIRYPADEPLLTTLRRHGLNAGGELERATMQSTVYGPVRRLVAEYGFDAMAYGLRAEESKSRQMHLVKRGHIFTYVRDGILACQPIAGWTYMDVWAFIVSNNLDYCGVYDKMWRMPQREQRVSYWAGETNRNNGRYVWLKQNYPEIWNRFAAEFAEARAYA
jgi:phosphoadenosine phosphosulfate reductase